MEGHIFLKDLLLCTIELQMSSTSVLQRTVSIYLLIKSHWKDLLVSLVGAMIGAAAEFSPRRQSWVLPKGARAYTEPFWQQTSRSIHLNEQVWLQSNLRRSRTSAWHCATAPQGEAQRRPLSMQRELQLETAAGRVWPRAEMTPNSKKEDQSPFSTDYHGTLYQWCPQQ